MCIPEALRFFATMSLAALSVSAPAMECGPGTEDSERIASGDGMYVKFMFDPAPPLIGDLFVVHAQVCRPDHSPLDGELGAEAVMPAHGHGMDYAVESVTTQRGAAVLRGFLWQMPGLWQLRFRLKVGDQSWRATHDHDFTPH